MIKVGVEREIKFDKSLREKRNEIKINGGMDWNLSDYETVDFEFQSGKKKVYKNFNFSIFVDDYCNADCKFCVAQLRYQNKNKMYEKKHLDTDAYLKRLDYILSLIRPLNPSISLSLVENLR